MKTDHIAVDEFSKK